LTVTQKIVIQGPKELLKTSPIYRALNVKFQSPYLHWLKYTCISAKTLSEYPIKAPLTAAFHSENFPNNQTSKQPQSKSALCSKHARTESICWCPDCKMCACVRAHVCVHVSKAASRHFTL